MSDDVTTNAEESATPAPRKRSRRATAPAAAPTVSTTVEFIVPETTVGGASVGESGTLTSATVHAHRRAQGEDGELLDAEPVDAEELGTEEEVEEVLTDAETPTEDGTEGQTEDEESEEGAAEQTPAEQSDTLDVFAEVDRFREDSASRPPAKKKSTRSRRASAPATAPQETEENARTSERAADLDVFAAFAEAGEEGEKKPARKSSRSRRKTETAQQDSATTESTEGSRSAGQQAPAQNDTDDEGTQDEETTGSSPRLPAAALLFQAPEPRRRPRRAQSAAAAPQMLGQDAQDSDEETDEDAQTGEDAGSEEQEGTTSRSRRGRGNRRSSGRGAKDKDDERKDDEAESADEDAEDQNEDSADSEDEEDTSARRRRRRGGRGRRRRAGEQNEDQSEDSDSEDDEDDADSSEDEDSDNDNDDEQSGSGRRRGRRRRGRGGRNSGRGSEDDADPSDEDDNDTDSEDEDPESGSSSRRRRRRRRSRGDDGAARARSEVTALKGSTRLEAKRQRRREGREAGRRRPIITESEYLARRESVERSMVVREKDGLNQIAVLEDGMLVEHYVARHSQTSMVGNVYLGRVHNVLPSMEAAFIDIGKGRNAVLYAGEVNWDAAGMSGQPRRIEQALKSGDAVMVQVTKDPIGHKGARLTSQITLAGRYLVLVPSGAMTGISRKLPENERNRLKKILKQIVPADAGVIVRTAAEGASEQQLKDDIERLTSRWADIQAKAKNTKAAPTLLKGEPELAVRVVRDVFNEDFVSLKVQGDKAWSTISSYVKELSPDLADRMHHWTDTQDIFSGHRIDEQLAKGMDRRVWLPSGGSLVIDRTEAMTVVDVNTGKFTGAGGTLEETVTKNNLEAAEEIVRQLRLRDIGGIIVIDFIDMVLESNRDLVLRRLIECLGRDRTRHQVAEVTSLGLVQMTRKRVGQGLVEAFSSSCEHCDGRGFIVHEHPVETDGSQDEDQDGGRRKSRRGGQNRKQEKNSSAQQAKQQNAAPAEPQEDPAAQAARQAVKNTLATIAKAAASAHPDSEGEQADSPQEAVDKAAADVMAAVEKAVADASGEDQGSGDADAQGSGAKGEKSAHGSHGGKSTRSTRGGRSKAAANGSDDSTEAPAADEGADAKGTDSKDSDAKGSDTTNSNATSEQATAEEQAPAEKPKRRRRAARASGKVEDAAAQEG